jgi:hypothetical protein
MSQRLITREELDFYLYGRTDVVPVKMEDGSPEGEELQQQTVAKRIPQYEGTQVSCPVPWTTYS